MVKPMNAVEAEEQEKSASWWEGFYKCVLSTIAAPYVIIGATTLTTLSLGFSAITKIAELGAGLILPKGYGQETLQNLSQQSRSLAANSFFTAISYAIPIIPFIEGCANMHTDRRNFGMADIGRYAARGLSGGWFGSAGIPQTEFEKFQRQQALAEEQNIEKQLKGNNVVNVKPRSKSVDTPKAKITKHSARHRLETKRKEVINKGRADGYEL